MQAREFLSETGLGDEREYAFRHALTQEVAYASLPEDRRRDLHARILHAIERVYASRLDDKVAELAHHAFEGERWRRGRRVPPSRGSAGRSPSANSEGAACFEQALVALSHLPDGARTRSWASTCASACAMR